MMTFVFGTALPWLLIAVGACLGYQFVRQNGRILLRLEAIEQRLAPARQAQGSLPSPVRLTIGDAAPEFTLPDLSGVRRRLSEFRGRDVLLLFFNPQCGYCTAMMDDLADQSADGKDGRPVPVVITTGQARANRELFKQHGVRCTVLRQRQMDVAARYGVQGTPMGFRIDAEGRIASELAAGAESLLKLATPGSVHPLAPMKGTKRHGKQPDPSLARSRINRSGLKAGTPAPDFRLPRLEGGELSLAELRGRRVLLVFSDPDCGPCDELAPQLETLHLRQPDIRVLVISRRDPEASLLKARKLGLTYPIVMQKKWEISLKYGMFATPIGYLIDERGVLLSDVAVGVQPILGLVEGVVSHAPDRLTSQRAPAEACSS